MDQDTLHQQRLRELAPLADEIIKLELEQDILNIRLRNAMSRLPDRAACKRCQYGQISTTDKETLVVTNSTCPVCCGWDLYDWKRELGIDTARTRR